MGVIARCNWKMDLEKLYTNLKVTPDVAENGSIISIKNLYRIRGIVFNKKKGFNNSITVVMWFNKNTINVKLFEDKMQMSGIMNFGFAEQIFILLFENMHHLIDIPKRPTVVFAEAMVNVNFNIGCEINRQILDSYIVTLDSDFKSVYETSVGYEGVIIKLPLEQHNHALHSIYLDDIWIQERISFNNYRKNWLTEDEVYDMENVKAYHTFIVFRSGNVMFSSKVLLEMESVFNKFCQLIKDSGSIII